MLHRNVGALRATHHRLPIVSAVTIPGYERFLSMEIFSKKCTN
jgi:hypothetical protein